MTDIWKGEDLIRSQRRPPPDSKRKRCAVPDCNTRLWERNLSGVCKKHNHSAWCLCGPCMKKRAQ